MTRMHRRQFMGAGASLGAGALAMGASPVPAKAAPVQAKDAPFTPDWSSLTSGWRSPAWFADAKFGIWAHWGPQCAPEQGDWYGRKMYMPGEHAYDHAVKTYGHPADRGFMEIIGGWRAPHWDPDALVARYKAVGARYFMAMACHHDNFDLFASKHHAWNATKVGPKRDIVGGWEKAARKAGLRFGVSNHTSHAWHWWQTAYGYDAQGPRKGQRYDAFRLQAADGKGTWWEGLDPQELYTGPSMVAPDGLPDDKAMTAWHESHDDSWMEFAPVANPGFAEKWLARQKDLVETYKPDIVYFDNYELPFGPVGLEALAHYYNEASKWHGSADVVLTAKRLSAFQRLALTEDIERGFSDTLRKEPWQTCTCIGDWHYNRARFDQKSYMPAEKVIQRLMDTVAKNGNLLLSVPVRGDGTIDAEEEKILDGIGHWMAVHGEEAIYGSRPWRIYGEGPTKVGGGMMGEGKAGDFVAQDVRFVVKNGALYAAFMRWPDAPITITALGTKAGRVDAAKLVGGGALRFAQGADGLSLTLPAKPASGGVVPMVELRGAGLV
jgi:alpha-L-fucosidase